MSASKIPVGILGPTGIIGQYYAALLHNHPWFELTHLAGSRACSYEEALEGRWSIPHPQPVNLQVHSLENITLAKERCRLVFSALSTDAALLYEEAYAAADIAVFSNASVHRQNDDVPLIIPEINSNHLDLIPLQQKKRGWKKGFLIAKPNCSIQSFMIPLHALHAINPIKEILVTTLQSVSGAGSTALSPYSIQDNVIPYISGEEEKTESEPLKIWGKLKEGKLEISPIKISAQCNRIPVLDGHLASVSVGLQEPLTIPEIAQIWKTYHSELILPSSPKHPIVYFEEAHRPQVRLDRTHDHGMSIAIGRLRPCSLLQFRFVGLSHNAIRGGAGGGILSAELLHHKGFL
jgi:aspartate-semialdehyde dehydrogenase